LKEPKVVKGNSCQVEVGGLVHGRPFDMLFLAYATADRSPTEAEISKRCRCMKCTNVGVAASTTQWEGGGVAPGNETSRGIYLIFTKEL
jgi:hypothetical protein